jgi:2-C-methyl-D-erythritol 4-phosphate cytidylyltransferase/2-C-methyl-D-erythritol 2,4-cyclodiphosphate synthase
MADTDGLPTGAVGVIIPAGGRGLRFGAGQPKQFLELGGWPVLAHTLSRFDLVEAVDQVVVVVPEGLERTTREKTVEPFGFTKIAAVVAGGETRQESVYNGFLALDDEVDLVVVHDGVRPLAPIGLIESVIDAAREHGAAIAAVPVRDTLKQVEGGVIQTTLDRRLMWRAQTPQAFDRLILAEALADARRSGFTGTDEAQLVERLGRPVFVVPGVEENIKITSPEDLVLAETLIQCGRERDMRVGLGFDVHVLAQGRKLMLGCVAIPFDRGLVGHSDGDVMAHALCDALLGAAGLGDIGGLFPDTDPKWAGAAGETLLKITMDRVRSAGFELAGADLTLLAQRPKIKPHAPRMVETMAKALGVDASRVNVKATTTEGLGYVGREEGLAAQAVALLQRKNCPGPGSVPGKRRLGV